jgi:DNA-binding ferritin-like protein
MTSLVQALVSVWANLRAEHQLFWTYHWRAKGAPYYGDHLLYQRLYEARLPEIDRVGEVLMALGGRTSIDPMRVMAEMNSVMARAESMTVPDAKKAEALVVDTLKKIEAANEKVNESPFPLAVNNVLAGISDKHLEALYLLKQRSA